MIKNEIELRLVDDIGDTSLSRATSAVKRKTIPLNGQNNNETES